MAKKKGQGKLKRTSRGSVILPNGQRITPKEQKALRSAVNSANRKRKRLLESLPPEAKRKYRDFGVETDFVMRKKSTSLNRFRNKNEFNKYLRSVQKIASGEFEKHRAEQYKRNYIQALRRTFNSKANEAIRKVREMDLKTFRRKVESEELEDIGYVYYDPNNEKLTRITEQLA